MTDTGIVTDPLHPESGFDSEYRSGLQALSRIGKAVTVFGSARVSPKDPLYGKAETISRGLVEYGYAVITGGGGGLMEAANKGAAEAGGVSAGLNIRLPFEQKPNAYANIRFTFNSFPIRKQLMIRVASAFIVFPGGMGTLDELFETAAHLQTRSIPAHPLVLVDSAYWTPLRNWLTRFTLAAGHISPEDPEMFRILDDPAEIIRAAIHSDSVSTPDSR